MSKKFYIVKNHTDELKAIFVDKEDCQIYIEENGSGYYYDEVVI